VFGIAGSAGADVESDGFGVRGQGIEAGAAAPGGEVPPVLGIGVPRVFGAGSIRVAFGRRDQFFDMRRDTRCRPTHFQHEIDDVRQIAI
jgi:hypothetical protein